MDDTKFKVGERVMVVKYGHPTQLNDVFYDAIPDIVGRTGVITQAKKTDGKDQYSIDGIPEKFAWYENSQLDLFKVTIN